jgi:type I restriction enzyme M protein
VPPHEWESDFKSKLAEALNVDKTTLINSKKLALFDVIVTNPPFGSKIPIKDPHILEQFTIAYIWEKDPNDRNKWTKTNRLQSSVPPEQLFLERCLQFLKPGGRLGIVLPDAILGAPGLGYIRQWLLQETHIVASIDLHADTFQPRNGTQTSVLIIQKKSTEELSKESRSGKTVNYNIFMAMVESIGHDKRGNPVFKCDEHGNEILVPEEIVISDEESSRIKTSSMTKVLDDQSKEVPALFHVWKKEEGISW